MKSVVIILSFLIGPAMAWAGGYNIDGSYSEGITQGDGVTSDGTGAFSAPPPESATRKPDGTDTKPACEAANAPTAQLCFEENQNVKREVGSCEEDKKQTVVKCYDQSRDLPSSQVKSNSINDGSGEASSLMEQSKNRLNTFADKCEEVRDKCLKSCKAAHKDSENCAWNAPKARSDRFQECSNKLEVADNFYQAVTTSQTYKGVKQNYEFCDSDEIQKKIDDARGQAKKYGEIKDEAEGVKKASKDTSGQEKKPTEQAKNDSDKCATNGSGSGSGSGASGGGSSGSASSGCGGGGGGGSPGGGGGGDSGSPQQANNSPTATDSSTQQPTGLTTQNEKVVAARGDSITSPESSESSNPSASSGGSGGYHGMQAQRSPASAVGGYAGGGSSLGSSGGGGSSGADGKDVGEDGTARAASAAGGGSYGGGGGGGWNGFGSGASAADSTSLAQAKALPKYLPGAELDPKKTAGLVGEDGVTGPNQFNWEKMHKCFQRQADGPIGFLP